MLIVFSVIGVALVALITTGSTVRRMAGLLIAGVLVITPFLMTSHSTLEKLVVMTFAVLAFLKGIDLAAECNKWPAGRRLLHTFVIFDTRIAKRTHPHFQFRRFLEALMWILICVVAMYLALNAAETPVRWLYLMVGFNAAFEILTRVTMVAWGIAGYNVPLLHSAPYKSRSIREFWSMRWNRIMGRWLREHCYAPFARTGRRQLGFVATFVVSAIIHWYIIATVLDWFWGAMAMSFFLVQIPLIFIEDAFEIRRRPVLVAHAWTCAALVGTSPLIIAPLSRLLAALE